MSGNFSLAFIYVTILLLLPFEFMLVAVLITIIPLGIAFVQYTFMWHNLCSKYLFKTNLVSNFHFLGHQEIDHHLPSIARLKVQLTMSVNLRYRVFFLCLPWWLDMVFIMIWPYEMSSRFMVLQIYRVCKEYLSQNDLRFKRKIMITIVFMFYGDY